MLAKSLPRGFDDSVGLTAQRVSHVISTTLAHGAGFGCEPLFTSPVLFQDCVTLGREFPHDRIFSFTDRRNRKLVLNPDATTAVIRWIAENVPTQPMRLSFVNPTFRYRRQKRRHFHQIGFAIAGEVKGTNGSDDLSLLLLREALSLLSETFGLKPVLQITDHGLWLKIGAEGCLSAVDVRQLRHQMRYLKKNEQIKFVEVLAIPKAVISKMKVLIDTEPFDASQASEMSDLFRSSIDFVERAVAGTSIRWKIAPSDPHGSEMQSGLGFQLLDQIGKRFGDGGCYSDMAMSFDKRIQSFFSFCTGAEWIATNAPFELQQRNLIAFVAIGVLRNAGEHLVAKCRNAGFNVLWRQSCGNVSRDVRQLPSSWRWAMKIGVSELSKGEGRLMSRDGSSVLVKLEELVMLLSKY